MKGQTTIWAGFEYLIVKPINGWVDIHRSKYCSDNLSPSEAKKLVKAINKAIAVIEEKEADDGK